MIIKTIKRKVKKILIQKPNPPQEIPDRFKLHKLGFHGDLHLLKVIDNLIENGITTFIETGTNVGSSLLYLAEKYPNINCISCEPDKEAYDIACKNTAHLKNVRIYNLLSQDFIEILSNEYEHLYQEKILVWLDAHGYGFDWPLRKEVNYFTSKFNNAFMAIDDFKVPKIDAFKYDAYNEQECSHDYINQSIATKDYTLLYPAYTEKTSTFHPLKGWGIYILGNTKPKFNKEVETLIQKA